MHDCHEIQTKYGIAQEAADGNFCINSSGAFSMSIDYRKCRSRFWRGALIGTLAFAGCTSDRSGEQGKQTSQEKGTPAAKPNHKEVGEASWYGPGFHGKETANGERPSIKIR